MVLDKIRRNKKGFWQLLIPIIIIGVLIWGSQQKPSEYEPIIPGTEPIPEISEYVEGECTVGPKSGDDAVCTSANPSPYSPVPVEDCYKPSEAPEHMKQLNECDWRDIIVDGVVVGREPIAYNYRQEHCEEDCGGTICKCGVCIGYWMSPSDGEDHCCNGNCVSKCGKNYKLPFRSFISYSSSDLDETDNLDEEMSGGIVTCSYQCFDYKYLVEGPCKFSDWCAHCSPSKSPFCAALCPPRTIFEGGECIPPTADPCENVTGLPYNDPADGPSYQEGGYSICKETCENIEIEGGTFETYNAEEGNLWCSQINGGTDYENYQSCCAYCPPGYHYDPVGKNCTSAGEFLEKFEWELACPIIKLSWGEDENADSYQIVPSYDEDDDKNPDGKCYGDIDNTDALSYEYNLETSSCVEHYSKNVRIQVVPQYSDEDSVNTQITEWIDVSVCNLSCDGGGVGTESLLENCTDGIDNDENGYTDCKDIENCPEGEECTPDGTMTCQNTSCKLTLNIITDIENCTDGIDNDENGYTDCKDTDSCLDGDECNEDGTQICQDEECISVDSPDEHNADNTGTKDDYDNDTLLNDEDEDMDGDGIDNHADDEGGNFDDETWTPFGCAVDDHGVAIDKDGDGLCKGRDDLGYDYGHKLS